MKNTVIYFKSVYTGQVYRDTEFPTFGGYVPSTEEEFNAYYISKGIDPKTLPRF